MTRIIQKCFLVLVFTGALLASAEETTVSDISDSTPQSNDASSSAPNSVGTPSSYTPLDKEEDENRFQPRTATSSSNPEITTKDLTESSSKTSGSGTAEKEDVVESTTTFVKSETKANDSKDKESATLSSVTQSERLNKDELQEDDYSTTEISSERSSSDKSIDKDSSKDVSDEKSQSASNRKDEALNEDSKATSETSMVSEGEEDGETTKAAAFQSTEVFYSKNVTNDSGQSSVPSKEELIYNSSYIDKNQPAEEMPSTTPSKVQTEESDTNDSSKRATRKRSLNATNTMTSSTVAVNFGETSSSAPTSIASSHTIPPLEMEATENDSDSVEVLPKMKSSNREHAAIKTMTVIPTHETVETELAGFPHTISDIEISGISADHFHESEHLVTELTLSDYPQDTHMSPLSSAALSTLNEDSLHPLSGIETTVQTSNERRGISTLSSIPQKSGLEIEHAVLASNSDSSVTFDPNGMKHNFSQDPDSVTFSPGIFHVDGMPTDGHLSRFEHGETFSHKPGFVYDRTKYTDGMTQASEVLSSNSRETEGSYMEREKEVSSSSSHGLLPHDEPDVEEMSNRNIAANTKQPEVINAFPTGGSVNIHTIGTPDTNNIILPVNDETEEMLNDSPHFAQSQSKPTVTPTAEVKNEFISKNLEVNVSNDIRHTTGSSPQNTPESVNELDFLTEYQTDQSEIRPVTAVHPLKLSESITLLPDHIKVESHSPSEAAISEKPDTFLPDTSSPIILPNPAPNVVNQSAETTTIVLQPDFVPQSNASVSLKEQGNDTTGNTTSTIAGVAVKTSVSVSLPLSKTPNDTTNSTVVQARDDVNVSSNISKIILPIPINKDADGHPPPTTVPTEASAPSTTTLTGLRIRKPKLKFTTDDDEPATPRTRKPFIISLQKPSTTVGPPVSIFKKARTRIASITSSTTARPFPQFSTIRIHYASRIPGVVPNGELVFSVEPITTTIPTTTETEEPFSDEPFTEQTQGPIFPSEDDVTLIRVAGCIVVEKGLRWNDQLHNRHSPQWKEKANFVQMQLYRLFKTSPIASQLWKIQIDGFSGRRNSRSVVIDFFLYLIKSPNEVTTEQLISVFHDKLKNNTFSRFTVDTNKTTFEFLNEEPMNPTTEPPEEEHEPVIPQWAIAVIVVGAASLIFIVLFAAVAILGRHHVRRRYSSKLNDEDSDRPSDWESKMAAAYENLAADTIYDAEDLHSDTYKKRYHNSTFHGRPSQPRRADSWSSSDWSPPPRRPRPQVHRIVY